MGNQVIAGQWSLNETSTSVYSIARGVLQAATSDNVQPLALMACEQFGNTLAISRETRLKIERTVLPMPEPVALQFLKVKVGFMKHDCAIQLGSNQAGLRFLALASALVSSVSPYHCAEALVLMLEETTSDQRLLPTTRHLVDLISSIEGRCRFSGFADIVHGYIPLIKAASLACGDIHDYVWHSVPDSKGLAAIVDACRQLQRIGDDEPCTINVETRECAAWVAAFVKWSLELPPSIIFAEGSPAVVQPGSQFTIIIPKRGVEPKYGIKTTRTYKLNSIRDLVVVSTSHAETHYRLSPGAFGDSVLDSCSPQTWARDAVLSALPLAIRLVYSKLGPGKTELRNPGKGEYSTMLPSPLPKESHMRTVMRLAFGVEVDFDRNPLQSAESFRSLPEVEQCFQMMEDPSTTHPPYTQKAARRTKTIRATWWAEKGNMMLESIGLHAPGLSLFVQSLSLVCHALVLMSLFDNVEDIFFVPYEVFSAHKDVIKDSFLYNCIRDILTGYTLKSSFAMSIGLEARNLLHRTVRHDNQNEEDDNVLISTTATHVVWYSILEDLSVQGGGILQIRSCRGRIIHERQTYNQVTIKEGKDEMDIETEGMMMPVHSAVDNPLRHLVVRWEVHASLGQLHASLTFSSAHDVAPHGCIDPMGLFYMLMDTVLVNCDHSMNTAAKEKHQGWEYKFPCDTSPETQGLRRYRVYPLGGVESLQLYCLGWMRSRLHSDINAPVILRQRACLDCCFRVCRDLGSYSLIL